VVNEKFEQFLTYLCQNCITNRFDAAYILRKIYDKILTLSVTQFISV